MPRRLIIVTALVAGMCITAMMTLATPALAKGPSQARIMGPGLAHGLVITGAGEPGQLSALSNLASRTVLFTVLFGPGGGGPAPTRLRTPLRATALGVPYAIVYTVPGVTPQQGQRYGRIRQVVYPFAKGGPVIYTPAGQMGFGQPLQVTGWMRGGPRLASLLAKLGVPPRQRSKHSQLSATRDAGGPAAGWLVGSVVVVAVALAGVAWRLRHGRTARGAL